MQVVAEATPVADAVIAAAEIEGDVFGRVSQVVERGDARQLAVREEADDGDNMCACGGAAYDLQHEVVVEKRLEDTLMGLTVDAPPDCMSAVRQGARRASLSMTCLLSSTY